MDGEMLSMAYHALQTMLDPWRILILAAGVLIGLAIGAIPGLGGIVGLAILIPFTYDLDPYAAFAFLLGMASVTNTSDTIPAVLFGVPGTAGAAATVMDGYPLSKQGQAGRAFGAAYLSSMLGGVFGALLLAVSIPILRPVMLYIGSPELLALTIFGLSMVAVLSGSAPMKGLAAAAIGLMIAMIGAAPRVGTLRWTFDSLYLWDGLEIVPVTLGFFALPELIELAIARTTIATSMPTDSVRAGQWQGMRDVAKHWWLVLRCSWIGAALGAVPGIGSAIIDWIAYGYAARSEKNTETFGSGDIRGVIAPESANNAKEGGALVPTIAFGVPGSASMALLLAAFLIHGLVPGPDMLTKNLDVTYAIVWTVAMANILGAGICFLSGNLLGRLALVRYTILLPLVVAVIYVGAFQGSRSWGDLYVLLIFGVIGWIMKRFGWPRPPLILGFVLGGIFERYLFISVERYGLEWLERPGVVIVFLVAVWGMYKPMKRALAATAGSRRIALANVRFGWSAGFTVALMAVIVFGLYRSIGWPLDDTLVPRTAGVITLICLAMTLAGQLLVDPKQAAAPSAATQVDLGAESELPVRTVLDRAGGFIGWCLVLLLLIWLIGFLPAMPVFIVAYMVAGRERPLLALQLAAGMLLFSWFVFDWALAIPWPRALLGDLLPALRAATGLI
ncbi:MAG: tripartite tricarboxylate transporter permease [Kiloniellales bacterium]